MLRTTRCVNMVFFSVKLFRNLTSNNECYGPDTILLEGHAVTLTFKVATQMLRVTRRLSMVIIL